MGMLARLFGGGTDRWVASYKPAATRLPAVTMVRAGRFAFGIPWPWEEAPPGAVLDVDAPPVVAVTAPRTDARDPIFCVTYRSGWEGLSTVDAGAWLDDFARRHRAHPVGSRRVLLGGTPSIVFSAASGNERVSMLVTSLDGVRVEGFLRAPIAAYLHHFEVMLATWRWNR